MADQTYYEVERLLQKKVEKKRVYYLVRWKNYPPEYDTWEPAKNLKACQSMFAELYRRRKIAKSTAVALNFQDKDSFSNFPDTNSKISQESARKTSQVIARQKVAAELKSKSKNLAKLGNKSKSGRTQSKHKYIKKTAASKSSKKSLSSVKSAGIFKKGKTLYVRKKLKENSRKNSTLISAAKKLNQTGLDRNASASKSKSEKDVGNILRAGTLQIRKKKVKGSFQNKIVKKQLAAIHKNNSGKNASAEENSTRDKYSKYLKTYSKSKSSKQEFESHIPSVSDIDSDDDNILYSLSDSFVDDNSMRKFSINHKESATSKDTVGKTSYKKNDYQHSLNSNRKRMSLMDFKKPKVSKQKSGPFEQLLRPSSPPVSFTPLKMVQSPLCSAIPNSTLTMDSLVGDVPTLQATPAGPLSPSSISYRSLLDSLPSQLHPRGKEGKKKDGGNGSSSGSSGQSSAAFDVPETIERRISVRATECVFRYKQIVVKKCHRYTQIWLNTQTVLKNAFNPQVVQEVVAALNTAKYDDSTLVLFSSIGSFFCSGTDLHFLTSGDRRVAARQMADALRELTKTFITFPKPLIAGVGGSAVGLGVALLCLCDVVYSSDKAAFHLPYAQLSQTPEGCSSFTLPLALGLAPANELLFGGRRITAMEAYQLGLVSHVFWPTAFMQEVIPRAQNMASCSSKVLEGTKLLIRSHHRTKMELTNETECNLLLERWSSGDCQQAMEAYLANENNFSS